ncbi:MAG: hypothetical protein ABH820_01205, partial [Patescibacteria group bacterium]
GEQVPPLELDEPPPPLEVELELEPAPPPPAPPLLVELEEVLVELPDDVLSPGSSTVSPPPQAAMRIAENTKKMNCLMAFSLLAAPLDGVV